MRFPLNHVNVDSISIVGLALVVWYRTWR